MNNKREIEVGSFYHIYNRGVEKRIIFQDEDDFLIFVHYLYALNHTESLTNLSRNREERFIREKLVHIHGFCLMKNHYHILLEEIVSGGISKFMQKLGTGYTMYFNKKYGRSGVLFQGKYKSKKITTDGHFNYILHYIHLNPYDEGRTFVIKDLVNYRWSSLPIYLDHAKGFNSIVETEYFLKYFGGSQGYEKDLIKSALHQNDKFSKNLDILIDPIEE
jgi:REP element-mobilizing transposase RayT